MSSVINQKSVIRPKPETDYLVRLWNAGKAFSSILVEMAALGWQPHEVDLELARVCGYLPSTARSDNFLGEADHG